MRLICGVQTDNKYCHRLATIIDKHTRVSNDVTVCTGQRQHQRSVSHITADSAVVEVRLYSPSTTPSHSAAGDSFGDASLPHSLLKYEGRSHRQSQSTWSSFKQHVAQFTKSHNHFAKVNRLKGSGGRWLHFEVFSAIQV